MLHYLIQTQIAWLLFYGLYAAILSRETFFRLNRVYLCATLLLGIVLPLMPTLIYVPSASTSPILTPIVGAAAEWTSVFRADTVESSFPFEKIIFAIYSLGFAVALARFLTGLLQIFRLYKNGEKEAFEGCTLVYTEGSHLPFSFFNLIFINPQIIEFADYQHIIVHEQTHVRQRHSLDVVFFSLVGIVFWWSPLVYFYKKSLRNVHEYLADASVLSSVALPDYGDLLLRQRDNNAAFPLANHFIFSQLKKRFLMMTRRPSASFATAKYAFAAPIIALLLLAFTNPIRQVSTTAIAQLTPIVAAVSTAILPENAPKTPVLPKIEPIAEAPTVVPTTPVSTAAQPLEQQISMPQVMPTDTSKPASAIIQKEIARISMGSGDTPENAQPGHCYAKCLLPDKINFAEWHEVVCGDKVTEKFIKSFQRALREKGYEIGAENTTISPEMKRALVDFQQKNKLPVGNLNYETLKVLMSDFKDYEVVRPQKK
jgi:hypothetical protein